MRALSVPEEDIVDDPADDADKDRTQEAHLDASRTGRVLLFGQ